MKISRIKHVLITSIIFLSIIGIMLAVFKSQMDMVLNNTANTVYRVVAKRDIEAGEVITVDNVDRIKSLSSITDGKMIYRLNQNDIKREMVDADDEVQAAIANNQTVSAPSDDLWAIGKIANTKIYRGQALTKDSISLKTNVVPAETRLYSIPFDSETTGGYNISNAEKVDICVLYNDDEREIAEYQKLPSNKVIDIVLAEKKIADIRDESGNSAIGKGDKVVVPGYVCFNLTYEEINKVELAKRQGTLFIGKPGYHYKEGSQNTTFMVGATMPNFN